MDNNKFRSDSDNGIEISMRLNKNKEETPR